MALDERGERLPWIELQSQCELVGLPQRSMSGPEGLVVLTPIRPQKTEIAAPCLPDR